MSREPVAVRTYRAATRLYPRRFRAEYAPDMVRLFRDQCGDERTWRVASRAAVDLAITIPTQHLEARMRTTPTPVIATAYTAVAVAGLLVAIVGGTNPATAIIGLAIALVFGAVGVLTWRRGAPVRDVPVAGHWWKFLLAGAGLFALVIVGSRVGVEAWSLGVAAVATGFVLIAVGLVLGLAHLLSRIRRIPT